eukprot:6475834-Amphidinium_carterae.1
MSRGRRHTMFPHTSEILMMMHRCLWKHCANSKYFQIHYTRSTHPKKVGQKWTGTIWIQNKETHDTTICPWCIPCPTPTI